MADDTHPLRGRFITIIIGVALFVNSIILNFPLWVKIVFGVVVFVYALIVLSNVNYTRESRLLRVGADGKKPTYFAPTTSHQGNKDVPLGEITSIILHDTLKMKFLYFDTEKTETSKSRRFYLPLISNHGFSWRQKEDYEFLKQAIENTQAPDDLTEDYMKNTAVSKMFNIGKKQAIEALHTAIFETKD